MNIGMKMPLMKISEGQKWSLPRRSLIFRPVALGNQ